MLHLTNLAAFCQSGEWTHEDILRDITKGCGGAA
jgi:hypothetical protein